jgi:ParB-like chromosome segregation protein Spo0J
MSEIKYNLKFVKASEVKANPNNPRVIKDDKFKMLVNSIKNFPQMLQLRPLILNAEGVVLGGNMRLRACIDAKVKEIPVVYAHDLTDEQQREFIIKDNVGYGEWDWDILANEWDCDLLQLWGLDIPSAENESAVPEQEESHVITITFASYETMQRAKKQLKKILSEYPDTTIE